jgi:hypothetical protein
MALPFYHEIPVLFHKVYIIFKLFHFMFQIDNFAVLCKTYFWTFEALEFIY